MAEALVSTILEQLASLAKEDQRRLVGVYEEVKQLGRKFQEIQHVLEDAESKQMQDSNVRDWLEKLQDTSYDIDDVLDEWNSTTRKLRFKEDENASNLFKKVRSSISSHWCHSKQSVLRQNIALKIKELNKTLDVIVMEKDRFNFVSLTKDSGDSSIICLPKVCGRDYDKNRIINHLVNENSEALTFTIISMVGMIGIEKTTLAQLVFNDDLSTHFDIKIWVSVRKVFDEIMIAKAILKSLKLPIAPNLDKLETLLGKIYQCLEGKKFLLVLDDVWIENPKIWIQFKHSFNNASPGSRILVTTCTITTAKLMGTSKMILIGNEWQSSLLLFRQIDRFRKTSEDKLSYVECWCLLSKVMCSTLTCEERESLGQIFREIVVTCNGLPFAVKILGSLLSLKTKVEQWKSVYSEILNLEKIEKSFPSPLLLSYYDLPSKLKKCFLYCAIFPKEYVINKDKLIKLWMAQGYLKVEGREDMELVGEEYFAILAMRYFFQDFERSLYDGSIVRCKMHSIVHDFAKFLMAKLSLTLIDDGHTQSQVGLPSIQVRHAMILGDSIPFYAIYNEKNLRSLVVNRKKNGVDLSKLFELTCLRTLDLSDCSIEEIPGKIKNLIHLRYLNLSHNAKIEELPETLCELYNLQILDLSNCYSLRKLPHGIGKLINLRHLINHRTCLSYMPKGIERLTCLQTLNKFVASDDSSNEKVGSFTCLENLKNLEGFLSITSLGNMSDVSEVNKGKLKDKEKLYGLSLRFDGWTNIDDKRIFEGFEPPPNLEELVIKFYTGRNMPLNWIKSLTKLRMLKLISCFEFESLPDLGKLSSLESLIIWNMRSVKKVGSEFLGIVDGTTSSSSPNSIAFPKLRYLNFCNMGEWEELMWSWNPKSHKIMPCLRHLVFDYCPKLKSLSLLGELPSLESLVIKRMKSVKRAGNEFLGTTSSSSSTVYTFPQLTSLEFEDMGEWEEWNVKWEQRVMPNLLSLRFHSCPNLKALPDSLLHRPALQKLIINDCSILEQHYQKKTGMEWYKISHIPYIQIDSSKYIQGNELSVVRQPPDTQT